MFAPDGTVRRVLLADCFGIEQDSVQVAATADGTIYYTRARQLSALFEFDTELVRIPPGGDADDGVVAYTDGIPSLAIGVAERCCRLIGPSKLDGELAARRAALDAGTPESMPAARAAAARFAVQVASALVVHDGSRSVVVGSHAERLLREATLLLVFGSRPSIRRSLAAQLGMT